MNADTRSEDLSNRIFLTLHEYLEAIPKQKLPNPPDLMAIFAQLDALQAELQPGDSPELRHYMHQKSYRKAYELLKDQESENAIRRAGR